MTTQTQPTCKLIRLGESYEGKQAFTYFAGVSAESAGSQGLCLHLVKVPPSGRAKAHYHENHETAIYVLSGEGGMWYGPHLEEHMEYKAGDFIYIPAGVPHLPYNSSATETSVAVIARTDPNEQESVVLRPDLDGLH